MQNANMMMMDFAAAKQRSNPNGGQKEKAYFKRAISSESDNAQARTITVHICIKCNVIMKRSSSLPMQVQL